jgi:hypothetical protein
MQRQRQRHATQRATFARDRDVPVSLLFGLLAMIKCSICSYQCDPPRRLATPRHPSPRNANANANADAEAEAEAEAEADATPTPMPMPTPSPSPTPRPRPRPKQRQRQCQRRCNAMPRHAIPCNVSPLPGMSQLRFFPAFWL